MSTTNDPAPAPGHTPNARAAAARPAARVAFGPGSTRVAALDAALTELIRLDREFRALEARRTSVLAMLHATAAAEAESMQHRGAIENSMAYRSAQAELAAALQIADTTAGRHLAHAQLVHEKYPAALVTLAESEISPTHMRVITEAGRIIGTDHGSVSDTPAEAAQRKAYEALVVEKAKTSSPAVLKRYAKRIAERFATVSIDERHERAKAHRMVTLTEFDDGMARLNVILPIDQAAGSLSRVRGIAKQLQVVENKARQDAVDLAAAHGHEAPLDTRRTLSQIQADLIAELLLRSDTEMAHEAGPGVRGIVQVVVRDTHLLGSLDSVLDPDHGATAAGTPIPELESYGPVPIEMARKIAGSTTTWLTVTKDPATGAVTRVEPRFPSLDERRKLLVRDETCRWFGCTMPAHHCDVDHTVDYAQGGPTTLTNMGHACRNHHLLKHHGGWQMEQHPNGDYVLTSPTGRSYRTEPSNRVRFTSTDSSPPSAPAGVSPPPSSAPPLSAPPDSAPPDSAPPGSAPPDSPPPGIADDTYPF